MIFTRRRKNKVDHVERSISEILSVLIRRQSEYLTRVRDYDRKNRSRDAQS